jgi:hypothetical protein
MGSATGSFSESMLNSRWPLNIMMLMVAQPLVAQPWATGRRAAGWSRAHVVPGQVAGPGLLADSEAAASESAQCSLSRPARLPLSSGGTY